MSRGYLRNVVSCETCPIDKLRTNVFSIQIRFLVSVTCNKLSTGSVESRFRRRVAGILMTDALLSNTYTLNRKIDIVDVKLNNIEG